MKKPTLDLTDYNFLEDGVFYLLNNVLEDDDEVLFMCYTGSKMYGVSDENSDTDMKCIVKTNSKKVINISTNNSKNTSSDLDIELIPYSKWIEMLKDRNIMAQELASLYISGNEELIIYEDMPLFKEDAKLFISPNVTKVIEDTINSQDRYKDLNQKYLESKSLLDFLKKSNVKRISDLNDIEDFIKNMKYVFISDNNLIVVNKKYPINAPLKQTINSLIKSVDNFSYRAKNFNEYDGKREFNIIKNIIETIDILKHGFIQFPLKDHKILLDIKRGRLDLESLKTIKEQYLEVLKKENWWSCAESNRSPETILL